MMSAFPVSQARSARSAMSVRRMNITQITFPGVRYKSLQAQWLAFGLRLDRRLVSGRLNMEGRRSYRMTFLLQITTTGRVRDAEVPSKREFDSSFVIRFRDGKLLSGDHPRWRSELVRSVDLDEAIYAIECVATAKQIVSKYIETKARELYSNPGVASLEVDFAYGAIVDAKFSYRGQYLREDSLDILERLSTGNFSAHVPPAIHPRPA
jgi:hypothetical protein